MNAPPDVALVAITCALGLAVSFIGSMPVAGPISLLVVERGLAGRARDGMRLAVGSAIAEAGYALLAYWGVGVALQRFPALSAIARVAGALILVVVGIAMVRRRGASSPLSGPTGPHAAAGRDESGAATGARVVLLGFTITALNPTLLATWTAALTALNAIWPLRTLAPDAVAFAAGVGIGVVGWFALFLRLLRRMGHALRPATVDRVLRAIGWLILALALIVLVRSLGPALAAAPGP